MWQLEVRVRYSYLGMLSVRGVAVVLQESGGAVLLQVSGVAALLQVIEQLEVRCLRLLKYAHPILPPVTFSKARSKTRSQSAYVSFHWNVAKESYEL